MNLCAALRSVAEWLRSVRASTTKIQSVLDGTPYWISGGKMLSGIWTITVAARGFLGTKQAVYGLCLLTPELAEKFE